MLFTFLLVVQAVVAVILVALILMQRSEGGGLGVGGSSSGLMTARGQADFLTRATAVMAVLFVGLSIILAGIATQQQAHSTIDTSLVAPDDDAAGGEPPAVAPEAPAAGGTDSIDSDIFGTLGSDAGDSGGDGEAPPAQ